MTLVSPASIASLTRTFPVHNDEPLLHGDKHPGIRSSVDPVLLDVQDWFAIPAKVFSPRPLMSKNWRQYFRLTALLPAHYLVKVITLWLRCRGAYAWGLVEQLRNHGNIPFGLAHVPLHAAERFYRITGEKRFLTDPPELWMGVPSRVQSQGYAQVPNA